MASAGGTPRNGQRQGVFAVAALQGAQPAGEPVAEKLAGEGKTLSSPAEGLLRTLTVDVVSRIKAEIRLVGFWHNTYAQNTLRAWVATRLAEPMIDGEDLFDFGRINPVANRLVELAKANHARLAAS